MHPLDNVIWQALTTRQTVFAESCGEARRFMPEVTALGASRDNNVGRIRVAGRIARPE